MYEYEVKNIKTGEVSFMWGYSWKNAVRRAKESDPSWNEQDFNIIREEYVD